MLKGFKDFLLRGNVLDLAVAVVVGAAFTAIVTAFTSNIINPLVASIGGGNEYGWGIQLTGDTAETFLNFGAVVTAIINFIIIAAVVYFVLIVPYNHTKERYMKQEEKEATDIELLTEIRYLLGSDTARHRG